MVKVKEKEKEKVKSNFPRDLAGSRAFPRNLARFRYQIGA